MSQTPAAAEPPRASASPAPVSARVTDGEYPAEVTGSTPAGEFDERGAHRGLRADPLLVAEYDRRRP